MSRARVRSFLLGALAVGLIAFGSGGTYSAFSSTTQNNGDKFSAGTVHLTDNDSGSVMFNVSGMKPTDAARTSCITVTYDGSLDANVKLYASALSSTGVEPYINLTVETGTTTSGYGDCTGFTSISTLYSGTLASYPASYASGLAEPGNPWSTGEAHAYRFTVSVQNTAAAQGKTATVTLAWEAQNT
jgi:hypothetical protein